MNRITAQVAVEAIVNHPDDGWDMPTMTTVLADARALGVPALYVDMLDEMVTSHTPVEAWL